jgi:ureidoglycolate lyase
MNVIAEPLTPEAFAPFGTVIQGLSDPGRVFFNEGLASSRSNARFDLSLALLNPLAEMPLRATVMERHEFSSQTFLPLRVARYLIIVAPAAARGGPDTNLARAFVASGRQGLTYRMNTWHHGLTVLDEPGEFAVLMWCDGSKGDEEFCTLEQPFTVIV